MGKLVNGINVYPLPDGSPVVVFLSVFATSSCDVRHNDNRFVRLFCFLVDIKLYIPNDISLSVMLNSLSYSFTYTMYICFLTNCS